MVGFIYCISTVYLPINCQVQSCTLFMQVASIWPHLPSLGGKDVYWRWRPSDFVLHGPPQSSTVSIVYTSQTKVNVPECGTKVKRPWSASKSDSNDQQSFRHQLQWHLEACNNAEQGRFKIIQNDSASIPRPPKPHIDLARYKSSSGKLSLETLRNFTRCVGCFFCNCTTVVGVGTDTLVQKGTSMQEGKTTVQCRSRICGKTQLREVLPTQHPPASLEASTCFSSAEMVDISQWFSNWLVCVQSMRRHSITVSVILWSLHGWKEETNAAETGPNLSDGLGWQTKTFRPLRVILRVFECWSLSPWLGRQPSHAPADQEAAQHQSLPWPGTTLHLEHLEVLDSACSKCKQHVEHPDETCRFHVVLTSNVWHVSHVWHVATGSNRWHHLDLH